MHTSLSVLALAAACSAMLGCSSDNQNLGSVGAINGENAGAGGGAGTGLSGSGGSPQAGSGGAAHSCTGPNPQGCKIAGCSDGFTCAATPACVPSECSCGEKGWACSLDCMGGTCVATNGGAGGAAGLGGQAGAPAGGGQAGNGNAGGNQAGSGAAGNQAGSGGSAPSCLALDGAPITILTTNAPPMTYVEDLQMVFAGSSSEVVVGLADLYGTLHLGSFDGGGAWPAQLDATTKHPAPCEPRQFQLATGLASGTIALVAPTQPVVPDGAAHGLRVAPAEDPMSPAGTFVTLEDSSVAAFPRALVQVGGALLEIDESQGADFRQSQLRRIVPSGPALPTISLGCGLGFGSAEAYVPVLAGAIAPTSTGVLVAFSSLAGACPPTTSPALTAGDLRLGKVDANSQDFTFQEVASSPLVSQPDSIAFLRLVAHATGAWLVYQYAGDNALVPGPYMAIPLDLDGNPLGPPTTILSNTLSPTLPSVAGLGGRLAVAYAAVGGSGITVDLWDKTLQVSSTYSISTTTGGFTLPTTLLAYPGGDRLLVGWILPDSQKPQAYVARLSCLAP